MAKDGARGARKKAGAGPKGEVAPQLADALVQAACDGDKKVADDLLARGVPVDGQSSWGRNDTPLVAAAAAGHVELVEALLRAGADPNGKHGRYPLVYAARYGQLAAARALVEAGADVNAFSADFGPAHFDAAAGGHVELLRYLLAQGADPNLQNGFEQTALSQAQREIRMRKMREEDASDVEAAIAILKEAGATERTAAARATTKARSKTPEPKVEKQSKGKAKASPSTKAPPRSTGSASPRPGQPDKALQKALFVATARGDLQAMEAALQQGANPSAIDLTSGLAPIDLAVQNDNVDAARLLLRAGANPYGTEPSTMEYAVDAGDLAMVRLLVAEGGADPNDFGPAEEPHRETPLIRAVRKGKPELARLLLELGADAARPDDEGKTPAGHAAEQNDRELLRLLRNKQ